MNKTFHSKKYFLPFMVFVCFCRNFAFKMMMMKQENKSPRRAMLIILDGWGINPDPKVSAIAAAHTPFMDRLWKEYPHATLRTDGLNVGLPEGQMGNSEVGHMNLGAGRIVYQDLVKINKAIDDGSFFRNPELRKAFEYAKQHGKKVHLLGLVSDGGVHSHIKHLLALIDMGQSYGVPVCIHAFTDGRDVDPHSGIDFLRRLQDYIKDKNACIATVTGRYYAMDRDRRWQRVAKAYQALVNGEGKKTTDVLKAVSESYEQGVSDEFIQPIVHTDNQGRPLATIEPGDVVIFFNFRTDRGRQLTRALSQEDFPEYGMKRLPLYFVTMTNYDDSFKDIHVAFPKEDLKNTLGELVSRAGKSQLRIAETEKYPHVTFFFSGMREEPFPGEDRILIPSPKVATYDLQPEMSANEVTDALLQRLDQNPPDLVILNYANGDMVGHTGVFDAAVKAVETVDRNLSRLVPKALDKGYDIIILADHGNADKMINPDGTPNTAHTTHPVPVILVSKRIRPELREGILANVAPTLLELMGLKPAEGMEKSLIIHSGEEK